MAFFMIAAVHTALMILVLKVAGTMVAGWSVFGLARRDRSERTSAPTMAGTVSPPYTAPAAAVAVDRARGVSPANENNRPLDRRTAQLVARGTPTISLTPASFNSRAKGIGSRFRSAPSRKLEKFK
jgi:type IV secretion system protein VirB6